MPRNGSGVYSKPSGTTAVSGQTIASASFNTLIDDIAADQNVARPVVAGGTGGNDQTTAQTNLGLLIGTDVQAFADNLDYLSALSLAGEEGKAVTVGTNAFSTDTLLSANPVSGDENKLLALNASRDGVDFVGSLPSTTATLDASGGSTAVLSQSIDAETTEIDLYFDGVTNVSGSDVRVQLSTGGAFVTTGYRSVRSQQGAGTSISTSTTASAFFTAVDGASNELDGVMRLRKKPGSSNVWFAEHTLSGDTIVSNGAGRLDLGGTIDEITIFTTGSNFDGGEIVVVQRS